MNPNKIVDQDLAMLDQLILKSPYRYLGKVIVYRNIVAGLNAQMYPSKTWTWNYVHQTARQKLPLSSDLRIAIRRLFTLTTKRNRPDLEMVRVIAPIGQVITDSVLTGRTILCSRPDCGIQFVPCSPNQKYHSPECRKLARKQRINHA
jgi:hypothetical protein